MMLLMLLLLLRITYLCHKCRQCRQCPKCQLAKTKHFYHKVTKDKREIHNFRIEQKGYKVK